jgi:translation initiation factor IF-2
MPKKVYEVANEIGIGAIELVEKLKSIGMNVRNHMVSLNDDEVEKALAEFSTVAKSDKDKKPKVVTKKTTKKKVAKKKVVKKVVKKAAPKATEDEQVVDAKDSGALSDTKAEAVSTVDEKVDAQVDAKLEAKDTAKSAETSEEIADEATEKKVKTVVVKKKAVKKKVAAKKAAREASESNSKQEEGVFREKMHSFTPVFIPDQVKKKQEEDNAEEQLRTEARPKVNQGAASSVETAGKDKKRMGDLAAIVSKKGVVSKTKDVTQIRADEEMKLASNIVGRQIYTPVKKKKIYTGATKQTEITEVKDAKRFVVIHRSVTAKDLAQKLSQKFDKFRDRALELNLLVKEDDYLGPELAGELAALYDYRVEDRAFDEEEVLGTKAVEDKSHLPLRNPIITIMGHVDHGKTTLLDYIRSAKVTAGEAGGITQHIGSYSVKVQDATLTFLDTPGHAAFGSMRQRGANITDVVVLVVAADDGVMPQTVESIKYAKNAGCPIIVAINKMDKESANPERVKQELTEHQLIAEEWGGDTQFVPISALKGEGVDDLLDSIKLQAEMMELREDPKGAAEGVIIEAKVETGRGPVATVLVQKGTLKKGDAVVCGELYGRARSLMDDSGKNVQKAGPSIPVQILGLSGVPIPGDSLNVVKNEREAKKIIENRVAERQKLENAEAPKVTSLEDFFASAPAETGDKKILNLVVRADVQGSYEAIKDALMSLGNDEVGINIISGGVGAITDNDVIMASNAQGYIIGFNMRPVTSARRLSEQKGVEVRTYSIIYELINDVTLALEGMLEPEKVEKYIGRAEVRDTFNIPKIGTIAGSAVIDGKIERGCNIRLLRNGKIIHDGKLSTLKRFKDEVKEVANGYECGMALDAFNDVKVNDIIEAYIIEKKARKLEESSI